MKQFQTHIIHNGIIHSMEDNPEPKENETEQQPAGRPVVFLVLGLMVAFLLGLGAGYMLWARPLQAQLASVQSEATAAAISAAEAAAEAESAKAAQQAANPQAQQDVKRYPVPIDDDPIYGNEEAKITIIEFSDYECPYCQRWHQEVWPQVKAKYGDQVRLVYRDFPLINIHPNAFPAAVAANCAGEQDRYYDFNERLFSGESELGRAFYETIASDLNLQMSDFQKCLDENRYQKEVEDDLNYASELGVRSTPTFFINGLAVVGAQPFEVFEQVIDMELAGEIP
jgi:protein-disulfide isomerase